MKQLQKDDRLIVYSLDRLGHRAFDLLQLMEDLEKKDKLQENNSEEQLDLIKHYYKEQFGQSALTKEPEDKEHQDRRKA